MDEEKGTEPESVCPLTCPNRSGVVSGGFLLFGRQFKPVESLLHVAVLILVLGIVSHKAYKNPNFGPAEAAMWIAIAFGSHLVIGLSPTQRLETMNKLIELRLRK